MRENYIFDFTLLSAKTDSFLASSGPREHFRGVSLR
jgi:hypothetical protein